MVWMHDNLFENPWSQLDRTFAQLFRGLPGLTKGAAEGALAGAAMNVGETPEAAVIELEVPGVPQADLEVTVEGHDVHVRGLWPAAGEQQEEAERRFQRSVRFRDEIEAEGLEARLANGILTVTVPKSQARRPRQIPIQVPEAN